jgi:hypothetical protein
MVAEDMGKNRKFRKANLTLKLTSCAQVTAGEPFFNLLATNFHADNRGSNPLGDAMQY